MDTLTVPPMTQQRSRLMGRVLMAVAAIKLAWLLRGLSSRSLLASAFWSVLVLPVAGLLLWTGYTLSVMDWDAPADFPPAEAPTD